MSSTSSADSVLRRLCPRCSLECLWGAVCFKIRCRIFHSMGNEEPFDGTRPQEGRWFYPGYTIFSIINKILPCEPKRATERNVYLLRCAYYSLRVSRRTGFVTEAESIQHGYAIVEEGSGIPPPLFFRILLSCDLLFNTS